MIERITDNDLLIAIIVSHRFNKFGVHFFTENDLSQQLAYMHHPAGTNIQPHIHLPVPREVHYTQEILVIKKGRLRVDFYGQDQRFIKSRELEEGDVLLLIQGGHGFEVLEEIEMFEVKQGPYAGKKDKLLFNPHDVPDKKKETSV